MPRTGGKSTFYKSSRDQWSARPYSGELLPKIVLRRAWTGHAALPQTKRGRKHHPCGPKPIPRNNTIFTITLILPYSDLFFSFGRVERPYARMVSYHHEPQSLRGGRNM